MKKVYTILLLLPVTMVFTPTNTVAGFLGAEKLPEQNEAAQALVIPGSSYRVQERSGSPLVYSTCALYKIRAVKPCSGARFAVCGYWMIKNVIVSYFGQKQYAEARKFQDELYVARKKKKLPEGID